MGSGALSQGLFLFLLLRHQASSGVSIFLLPFHQMFKIYIYIYFNLTLWGTSLPGSAPLIPCLMIQSIPLVCVDGEAISVADLWDLVTLPTTSPPPRRLRPNCVCLKL